MEIYKCSATMQVPCHSESLRLDIMPDIRHYATGQFIFSCFDESKAIMFDPSVFDVMNRMDLLDKVKWLTVFISHTHIDHISGLAQLSYQWEYKYGRKDLFIVADQSIQDDIANFLKVTHPNSNLKVYMADKAQILMGSDLKKKLNIKPFQSFHAPDMKHFSFDFSIEDEDHKLLFSTNGITTDRLYYHADAKQFDDIQDKAIHLVNLAGGPVHATVDDASLGLNGYIFNLVGTSDSTFSITVANRFLPSKRCSSLRTDDAYSNIFHFNKGEYFNE